ncbi:MAG: RHS repeat-associated core domain-containing protein [Terracidiphilus sp.]
MTVAATRAIDEVSLFPAVTAPTIPGTTNNTFTYTGRETDGLGINYYRARYYNPTTGRFLSEDPSGFAGGINQYVYAHGDPINRKDPSGRYDWWWHAYITYQAEIAMGYSPDRAWAGAQTVANVDFENGSQGKDSNSAHKHSMAGRKSNGNSETCQQAYAGTQQQILNDLANGRADEAMHALQDATAPGHRGYQAWTGLSLSHMLGDAYPPQADIDEAINNTELFLSEYWNSPDNVNPADFLPQNPCN